MKIVKNTTRVGLMDLIAPHSCMGCGRLGEVLCECCKNDILCCKINNKPRGLYAVGEREDLLGELIYKYKYDSTRAIGFAMAEMLAEKLPEMDNAVVVPLPTATNHVRERGFDHTLYLAKKLAKLKGFKVERLLLREKNTVQVGADKKARLKQAEEAFSVKDGTVFDDKATYILLDDVWTTGASMKAAARKLKAAGAKRVVMAVVAVSEMD